jgi:hypothetical protein
MSGLAAHLPWHSVAAVLGGGLCLALTPVQAYIWDGDRASALVLACRPVIQLAESLYQQLGAQIGWTDYQFFGRMFVCVYLLALIGLPIVHERQAGALTHDEQVWYAGLRAALLLTLICDLAAYWAGGDLSAVAAMGFTFELAGLLGLLAASVGYGRARLRARAMPAWASWLLILAGPMAVPSVWAIGYLPHAAMLPFSIVLAVVGLRWQSLVGESRR